jgi:dihydropyrimidinase
VDALSTRAAKLFGLFPRKGTIAVRIGRGPGGVRHELSRDDLGATQHTNNDYNGFEGFAIEGRPSVVTVRGKVQVRDGAFVGEAGRGKMLRRAASPATREVSHAG